MEVATVKDLLGALPITIPICCRPVSIIRRDAKSLSVRVADEVTESDALAGRVPDIETDASDREILAFASVEEIRQFVKFYLSCPIGPSMLLGLRPQSGNRQGLRHLLINFSFDAWREMNGPKGKDGRLKRGVQCIAYKMDERYPDEHCESVTRNTSGLCRSHDKPDARTYWNYFPPPVV